MPNTPRTLAELDALYSDNNAGAISAQDLRDGFHSVANPVSGGGFDDPLKDRLACFAYLNPVVTIPACAPNAWSTVDVPLRLSTSSNPASFAHDGAGWGENTESVGAADPTNSYGMNRPSGTLLMIEPGIISVELDLYFAPAVTFSSSTYVYAQFDQAKYDPDIQALGPPYADGPWYYPAYYNPVGYARNPLATSDGVTRTFISQFAQFVNDTDQPQPFFVSLGQRNVLVDSVVTYFDMRIVREDA